MTEKGEKISNKKREIGKQKILEYIKTQKRFNDYIIIEYMGYAGHKWNNPGKRISQLGHQMKIKCLKCGYESIVSSYIFFVKKNQEKMYKCSADVHQREKMKNLNLDDKNYSSCYHEKYYYMWINMNSNCNPNLKTNNPRCRYIEKGIKIYKDWLFYEKMIHSLKNINAINYSNYEKFIDSLLEKHGFSDKDIKEKTIRIERIDKDGDFEPHNMGIRIFKQKKLLSMED